MQNILLMALVKCQAVLVETLQNHSKNPLQVPVQRHRTVQNKGQLLRGEKLCSFSMLTSFAHTTIELMIIG